MKIEDLTREYLAALSEEQRTVLTRLAFDYEWRHTGLVDSETLELFLRVHINDVMLSKCGPPEYPDALKEWWMQAGKDRLKEELIKVSEQVMVERLEDELNQAMAHETLN